MTDSDVILLPGGPVSAEDSPSERAGARARVAVTDGENKGGRLQAALADWWAWTARPPSLADTWAGSRIERRRVPRRSGPLVVLWRLSNWLDRPLIFLLACLAPTFLAGPMRWVAQRPARRWALYLLTAAVAARTLL